MFLLKSLLFLPSFTLTVPFYANHFNMLTIVLLALRDYWYIAITFALVAHLIHNKYYHGLHKYPGPILAAYTNWWRFFESLGQKTEKTTIALHHKHGDIVRLGPNVLSFADPQTIKIIYGLNKGFTKASKRLRKRHQ
jgi:hypothetical protein